MEYQPIKGLDSNSLPHDPGLKLGINDANKKKMDLRLFFDKPLQFASLERTENIRTKVNQG